MPKTSLHWPKGREILWQKFKKIAEREGRSMSRILVSMIEEYVRVHEPGNPQKRLDMIFRGEKAPVPRCSECGDPADRVYRVKGHAFFRCKMHRVRASRRTGRISWRDL